MMMTPVMMFGLDIVVDAEAEAEADRREGEGGR